MTAPVEGAVASLCDSLCPGAVTPPTAQQLTAVQGWGGAVAEAPSCACCTCLAAVSAEVGRLLKIDQVVRGRRLVSWVLWLQMVQLHAGSSVAAFVAIDDPGSTVKAILEEVPHSPKGGQTHPAGLHSARA